MIKIKARELAKMSNEQLDEKLKKFRQELASLNAQISVGTSPEKPSRVHEIKKNIARILMIKHINRKTTKTEAKKKQ